MRYDRERVVKIIDKMLDDARRRGIYQTDECINELEKLLKEVRTEAVGYTWTEACSQYDRGMDPRNFTVPLLMEKANEDLNPARD
jgi:hypothetical protein